MGEGAGIFYAEGVDPGSQYEGKKPVSVRQTIQNYLSPNNLYKNCSK
jgi:hypothetical protein